MGLFDKILGRDYKYYIAKSDKVKADDLGEAMACLVHAEELIDENDESAKAEIEAKRSEIKHIVYKNAFETAKQYLRSGQHQAAQNAIDRAAKHVQNDEEREALNALVNESHTWNQEEKIVEAHVEGEERVTGLDVRDKWNLYVTNLPFAKAQHCDELGDDFKKAWIALQEGEFDEALQGLEEIYKLHPDDALVMCELGRAYYGKGQFEKADELIAKSDETDPQIETKLLRTEVLWNMRKFDVAEEVLQAAHDADPENNNVLARIAQHGLISKDYESGIAAVEVLVENLPNDRSVHQLAGRLYLESGDEDNALKSFENVNRLFWQVNPQTKKITFDHNAAVAAANLYYKKNENLDRAVELLEAVRANSEGETHIAICMQLAEVYEKMGKKSKNLEVLDESTRFMDDALKTARGPERAMMQLQYAEVCDKLGDLVRFKENIAEAKAFFSKDADKGHPVASFYMELIRNRENGEPFPKADQMQARLNEFIEAHIDELRAKAGAAQAPAGDPELTSRQPATIDLGDVEIAGPVAAESPNAASAEATNKNANDIIAAMAALAPKRSTVIQPVSSEADEDDDGERSEDSSAEEASESNA